jgi:hypothetical protein
MNESWGPQQQELIRSGGRIAAIRSAPWTVRAGSALLVADALIRTVVHPQPADILRLPISIGFVALILAGLRFAWIWAIVLAVGDVVFAFAPPGTAWGAIAAALAIAFFLLPPSRRYFRPGRAWLPRRLEHMPHETWKKGGIRQAALETRVPERLVPRPARAFFVACRGRGNLSTFSHCFHREYVIAATDDGAVVLALRRPAIFRATIARTVSDLRADDPALGWDDEAFLVDGRYYRPIRGHEGDADEVARRLQFNREKRAA